MTSTNVGGGSAIFGREENGRLKFFPKSGGFDFFVLELELV